MSILGIVQASACMKKSTPSQSRRKPAHQRLLDAAIRVFARDGIEGATTRAIAREAGVNEVTLFRLFRSKENLLSAVVCRTFDVPNADLKTGLAANTGDLRKDLANYARLYESMLTENLRLFRTLIGEIHHHRQQEGKVAEGIFHPLRIELSSYLRQAQGRGQICSNVSPIIVADLLGGMIFAGALQRSALNSPMEYTAAEYLQASVEVLASGIEKCETVDGD